MRRPQFGLDADRLAKYIRMLEQRITSLERATNVTAVNTTAEFDSDVVFKGRVTAMNSDGTTDNIVDGDGNLDFTGQIKGYFMVSDTSYADNVEFTNTDYGTDKSWQFGLLLCDTTSGSINLELPTDTGFPPGWRLSFKSLATNPSANTITITFDGATIDGESTLVMSTPGQCVTLEYYGTGDGNWYTVNNTEASSGGSWNGGTVNDPTTFDGNVVFADTSTVTAQNNDGSTTIIADTNGGGQWVGDIYADGFMSSTSWGGSVETTTSAYTFSDDGSHWRFNLLLCDATSGAFAVTMPAGLGYPSGWHITIKKTDSSTHAVTVSMTSATIDGASTYVLSAKNSTVSMQYDGSNWYIISKI